MKISVIIPSYNEEKLLGRCLKAIKDQTVSPDEVIIVNNNSSDKTAYIAKSFGYVVIDESKQGISFARNAGFNYATGEILVRIDADTILPPYWIKTVAQSFTKTDVVGVSGPIVFHDFFGGNGVKKALGWIQKFIYFDISRVLLGHNVLFGSNMAIKKSAWSQIKNQVCNDDKKYHEDMDLSAHICQLGVILFESKLRASVSSRRVLKPHTFFDYTLRQIKSIIHAKQLHNKSDF